MAGALKRERVGQSEATVLLTALRDSNLPKFLADDAILFSVSQFGKQVFFPLFSYKLIFSFLLVMQRSRFSVICSLASSSRATIMANCRLQLRLVLPCVVCRSCRRLCGKSSSFTKRWLFVMVSCWSDRQAAAKRLFTRSFSSHFLIYYIKNGFFCFIFFNKDFFFRSCKRP